MATMKDVARDAGVALGTVSKVVNGIYVREEYRKRVEASIERLGYRMDYYARGLKLQQTNTIAVIVPDVINPFFAAFVCEIEKRLYESGYKMYLCQTQADSQKEAYYMKMVGQNKVDGIIGITYNETDSYVSKDMPLVTLDRHFKENVCCVSSDNYKGGSMAAEILAGKCSGKLLYIREGSLLRSENLKRQTGFEDFCKKRNISYETHDFGEIPQTEDILKYVQDHIQDQKFMFEGIFASTDTLGLLMKGALEKNKISIPEQVQIIGYDGIKCWGSNDYMLSSIAQPIDALARQCVKNVKKLIAKESVDFLTLLPVRFVEGGTTR